VVDIFNVQLFNDANGMKSWMNNCRDLEIDIKIQQVMGPHHAPAAERQIRVSEKGLNFGILTGQINSP